MLDISESSIKSLIAHKVVSKSSTCQNKFSSGVMSLSEDLSSVLQRYFFASMKLEEMFSFRKPALDDESSVYSYVKAIFDGDDFVSYSQKLAQKLHECSVHPKVKDGDLYVVQFENCRLEGMDGYLPAVGIFKSEVKELYLDVVEENGSFRIESKEGFSLDKLDKGAVIVREPSGNMTLCLFDNVKGAAKGANYWMLEYLQAKPKRDSRYLTQSTMDTVRKFVADELPKKQEISKQQQIDVLNDTLTYLNDNDQFVMDEYEKAVLRDEQIRRDFTEFKEKRLDDYDRSAMASFPIREEEVKKRAKYIRKIIKLDKDFSIHVHGKTDAMSKGVDEASGLSFYKILFRQEK